MKKNILFGSIIALLFLTACGAFNHGESEVVEAEAVEENFNIGETSTIEGISLTVDDAYYADKINRSANTNPDAILIVDLTVENNSGKTTPSESTSTCTWMVLKLIHIQLRS